MEQINTGNKTAKWYEYAILLFLILWSGGGFTYGIFPEWMLYMLPIVGFFFYTKSINYLKQQLFLLDLYYLFILYKWHFMVEL